ncbi:hypothetical protein D3C81_1882600 [compost metagenome]
MDVDGFAEQDAGAVIDDVAFDVQVGVALDPALVVEQLRLARRGLLEEQSRAIGTRRQKAAVTVIEAGGVQFQTVGDHAPATVVDVAVFRHHPQLFCGNDTATVIDRTGLNVDVSLTGLQATQGAVQVLLDD